MVRKLNLGVRELVDFCCRAGDLGGERGPSVSALDGLRTHQKLQKQYSEQAEAEYRIEYLATIDDYEVKLGGRIDLLFSREQPVRIEEIKTVYSQGGDDNQHAVNWGQLKCYGALYMLQQDLDEIRLSLNQVNLFSQREQRDAQLHTRAGLVAFVEQLLRQYLGWYHLVQSRRQLTQEQSQAQAFPFAQFREQQRQFAAAVFRCIRAKQRLMVEAPTGSGKTISTLFPAVKAVGEDLVDQVVFVSAKVSGQQQAVKAIEMMTTELSYVVIQAKSRSCPCNFDDNEIDDDGRCRRCIGFFDRLPAAREQLFNLRCNDVEQIQKTAAEYQLCPFELSLQMLPWVDIVICDFNYVFDPLVQLGYFRLDQRRKLLLIDELHNLVDRARGMYSASLSRRQIRQALEADNTTPITQALKAMQQALNRELLNQPEDEQIDELLPDGLLRACRRFSEKLGYDIFSNKHIANETLEFSKAIFRFQAISELYATHHRSVGYKPLPTRELKLMCLNAFEYLRDCYPLFESVCGFSATLSPPDYFKQALGLQPECQNLSLDSVFPGQRLKVCIANYVDTRYREREQSVDAICESIRSTCAARAGNYLVFFSSYLFMQQVHQRFTRLYPEFETHRQQRDFDEAAQQMFLGQFFEGSNQLGFAIMGGRFAEGIDYLGDALIGAIVVGVGLPQANSEQKLIQDDFEAMQLDGFDYAFRFPGLIRVMQSAGRVIRSESDSGVVVLLDQRFAHNAYRRNLPSCWEPQPCNSPIVLEQSLRQFWQQIDAADQP